MLYKFFQAQCDAPVREDWSEQIKTDLKDLEFDSDFSKLKIISKTKFKKILKRKIKQFVLHMLNEDKEEHSKMENLFYTELKIQDYLTNQEITTSQKQIIFSFRTRMAKFAANFGQTSPCKICGMHIDCQMHSVNCYDTMSKVKTKGNYNEIYFNNISRETAKMLEDIMKIRKKKEEEENQNMTIPPTKS